jgi:ABC-2 type transport system permease protein
VALAAPLSAELRSGPRYWLHTYALMVRWELLSQRLMFPLMVVLQIFLGAGMALGLGLFIENPTAAEAAYLATGATVFPIMTLGLNMLPQVVAQQKLEGTYEYVFGLPVPRMAMYFAGLTVWSVIGLPSSAVALAVAAWRYDIDLTISPLVIVAAFLVISVASAIGYAIGHGVPNPRTTNVITQVMIFVVILYSPVSFPAERLPGWLQAVHTWLPPEHSANVMRGTLTDGLVEGSLLPSFVLLGVWAVGSWVVTAWVITRRR